MLVCQTHFTFFSFSGTCLIYIFFFFSILSSLPLLDLMRCCRWCRSRWNVSEENSTAFLQFLSYTQIWYTLVWHTNRENAVHSFQMVVSCARLTSLLPPHLYHFLLTILNANDNDESDERQRNYKCENVKLLFHAFGMRIFRCAVSHCRDVAYFP